MTAVKTHSMALKEGDVTKIQIDTLNPTSSTSDWVCRLVFKRERRSMFNRLFNE
jgi:hypothetical protein